MIKLTAEQIYNLFVHRKDVFARQYKGGFYIPVRRPITVADIEKHLRGEATYGLYCLDLDNTIKWACIDLDADIKGENKEAELRRMEKDSKVIYELFHDFPRMREFSGRKGYHIWIFFNPPVTAEFGRTLVRARLNSIQALKHEVYPKQTELNKNRKYGNLVKIPQAVHQVSGKRSKILEMWGIRL